MLSFDWLRDEGACKQAEKYDDEDRTRGSFGNRSLEYWVKPFYGGHYNRKSRVDNIHHPLEIHKQSISSLQSEILRTYRARNNMTRNLTRIVDSLANLTMQIWELDSLLVANELLSRKQLPHVLINHTMLWISVIYLQFRLNELHTDLKLVHYDNAYYYKHAEFHVFRYKPQLIIRWNVTLILRHLAKQFTIWQLHRMSFFVRCSSSAGQEMFAGQRPTFYHCVTPPTCGVTQVINFTQITFIPAIQYLLGLYCFINFSNFSGNVI